MRTRLAVRELDIHWNNWSLPGKTSVSQYRHEFWHLDSVYRSTCYLWLLSFRKYSLICGTNQMVSSLQNQTLV